MILLSSMMSIAIGDAKSVQEKGNCITRSVPIMHLRCMHRKHTSSVFAHFSLVDLPSRLSPCGGQGFNYNKAASYHSSNSLSNVAFATALPGTLGDFLKLKYVYIWCLRTIDRHLEQRGSSRELV